MDADTFQEHRSAVSDLRWYFNHAESECGLKSNYGGMIYRLAMGSHGSETPTYEIDDRMLETGARSRRIERALKAMDSGPREVLWLSYGAPWPADLGDYGEIAALVPHTPGAQEAHRLCGTELPLVEWLGSISRRFDDLDALQTMKRLLGEAYSLRSAAMPAYLAVRRLVGPRG